MTQQKWVYVVDHRSPRENKPNSFANFIYPNQVEEKKNGFLTAGSHGADFGELRALEQSIRDPHLDYGGVLHYRRAPLLSEINLPEAEIFSNPYGHFIPIWSWVDSSALGWTNQKLVELSGKSITVLPKPIDVRSWGAANLYDGYLSIVDEITFVELAKSWEFADEFFKFLKSETEYIPFNIMLTSKETRAKVFDWLMGIINPLESSLSELSFDPVQKRWPGYLAEWLSTFYWHKNKNKVKPHFAETLRLDFAAEVSSPLGVEDYLTIAKNINNNFVLKTDSEAAIQALSLALESRIVSLGIELESRNQELSALKESISWKVTAPVRKIIQVFLS